MFKSLEDAKEKPSINDHTRNLLSWRDTRVTKQYDLYWEGNWVKEKTCDTFSNSIF